MIQKMRAFISTHLTNKTNALKDAKHAIRRAVLGSNPQVHGVLHQKLSNQQSPNLKPNTSVLPMTSIGERTRVLF